MTFTFLDRVRLRVYITRQAVLSWISDPLHAFSTGLVYGVAGGALIAVALMETVS